MAPTIQKKRTACRNKGLVYDVETKRCRKSRVSGRRSGRGRTSTRRSPWENAGPVGPMSGRHNRWFSRFSRWPRYDDYEEDNDLLTGSSRSNYLSRLLRAQREGRVIYIDDDDNEVVITGTTNNDADARLRRALDEGRVIRIM